MPSPHSDLTASDFLRAFSRHWKRAFLVFCAVVTTAVCWIVFAPKEYESTAKVYVRVGRENNTLDPSATTGQTVNIQQTLESEINSMLEVIGSRETIEAVAADIGTDLILANDLPAEGGNGAAKKKSESVLKKIKGWVNDTKGKILPQRFPATREQLAIISLEKGATIWSPKNSNVIQISCKAGHPELAQKIAKSWMDAFVEEHLRVTRTEGSLYFFTRQTEELQNRLLETEGALKEIKSTSGLVSIEGQRQVLEDQARSVRTRLLANESSLQASEAKLEELKSIIGSLPERVNSDQRTAEFHDGWNRLREKLFELQIREFELKSKYSATNPEVVAVISQREEVERILATQAKSASETVQGLNPTYQLMQQSLLNEQAQTAFLMAEQGSLKKQLDSNRKEIQALNENAVLISDLERQLLVLDTAYQESAARMEQARTLEAMESANISSISRLQHASLDPQPTGLGRLKTLLLGLIVGLIAAAGYAFVAEYFDRSFFTVAQVENSLDLPVLAAIPHSRRRFVEVN